MSGFSDWQSKQGSGSNSKFKYQGTDTVQKINTPPISKKSSGFSAWASNNNISVTKPTVTSPVVINAAKKKLASPSVTGIDKAWNVLKTVATSPYKFGSGVVKNVVEQAVTAPLKTAKELVTGFRQSEKGTKINAWDVGPAAVTVGKGMVDWVWSGIPGSLMRGTEDLTKVIARKMGRTTGPTDTKAPLGTGAPVLQDAFSRRKAEGKSTPEALGYAASDVALNVAVILGTVKGIESAPSDILGSKLFVSKNKVKVTVGDIQKSISGEQISPAKQRAILEIEKDPRYQAFDQNLKNEAIKRGVAVETATSTRFADRLRITPEVPTTRVTFKNIPTAIAPELKPFTNEADLAKLAAENKPQESPLGKPGELPAKRSQAELKMQLSDTQRQLRDFEKQQIAAKQEIANIKQGHSDIGPDKLISITVDNKPEVGSFVRSQDGRLSKVTEVTPQGAFRVVDPISGFTKLTTLESLMNDGVMKVKPGVEPQPGVTDGLKLEEAIRRENAARQAAADARKRMIAQQSIVEGKVMSAKTGKEIAGKANRETGQITINRDYINREYKNWRQTHPNTALKDAEMLAQFVAEHEKAHLQFPQKSGETAAAYEQRMHLVAIKALKRQGLDRPPRMANQPGSTPVEPRQNIPSGIATKHNVGEQVIDVTQEQYNAIQRRELIAKVKALRQARLVEGGKLTETYSGESQQNIRYRIIAKQDAGTVLEEQAKVGQQQIAESTKLQAQEAVRTPEETKTLIKEAKPNNSFGKKIVASIVKRVLHTPDWLKATKRIFDEINNPKSLMPKEAQVHFNQWGVDMNTAKIKGQAAGLMFDEIPGGKVGRAVIREYEAGIPTKYSAKIKSVFDSAHILANRLLGDKFKYWKDYLGGLRYENSVKEIRAAAAKMLVNEKGMTPEQATKYVEGQLLDEGQSVNLKLHPDFTKARIFETSAQAEKYGLTVKNMHPSARFASYVEDLYTAVANEKFQQGLKKSGQISPQGEYPINETFGMKGMRASREVANVLNGQFEPAAATLSPIVRASVGTIRGLAKLSKFSTQVILSAGIPFSPANFLSTSYLVLEGYRGNWGAFRTYMRSFSNAKSLGKFKSAEYLNAMFEMAQADHSVGPTLASPSVLFENLKNIKTGKGKGAWTAAVWERAWSKNTFNSLLPQIQIEHFIKAKDAFISDGMTPLEARVAAVRSLRIAYGTLDMSKRSKGTEDLLSAVFFAPKFRESIANITWQMIKSADPRTWKDPAYRMSRRGAVGMITGYALANFANHKMNGHFLWDNPAGKELSLQIPHPDGKRNLYIKLFPSMLTLPSNIIVGGKELLKGNPDKAARQFKQLQSIPLRIMEDIARNQDNFGNPIYINKVTKAGQQTDAPAAQVFKIFQYITKNFNHPYLQMPLNMLDGTAQLDEAVAKMFEVPINFSKIQGEQMQASIDNTNELAKYVGQFIPEHQPEVIKAELMKYPEPMRVLMLNQFKNYGLKAAAYTMTDKDFKAWTAGPHPVQLIKGLDTTHVLDNDNILFMASTPQKALIYAEAFLKQPSAILKLAQGEKIRKFRRGIVVYERISVANNPLTAKAGFQIDHIQPLAFGGDNSKRNLQYLTIKENSMKTSVGNMIMDMYQKGTIGEYEARRRAINWRPDYAKMTAGEAKYWYNKFVPK